MTVPRIDWPALAEPVALDLLGEPPSRTRIELRFGRRGSLSVCLDKGTSFDHEAGEGAPELPPDMRWLAAGDCCRPDSAAKWHGLPSGAAGALVFAWRPVRPPALATGALRSTAHHDPLPAALLLFALNEAAERETWFGRDAVKVRAVGGRAGTVFTARPPSSAASNEPVHAAEGEIDALALTLATWVGPSAVCAVGGTSELRRAVELPGSGPVTLHCDGDAGGREAGERARHAIEAAGWEGRVEWYAVGADSASALPDWLAEWSGIRESIREAREDANRSAWVELLRKAT